jgi:hypothetical protein
MVKSKTARTKAPAGLSKSDYNKLVNLYIKLARTAGAQAARAAVQELVVARGVRQVTRDAPKLARAIIRQGQKA